MSNDTERKEGDSHVLVDVHEQNDRLLEEFAEDLDQEDERNHVEVDPDDLIEAAKIEDI